MFQTRTGERRKEKGEAVLASEQSRIASRPNLHPHLVFESDDACGSWLGSAGMGLRGGFCV
jgi:hypothetical protein